MLRDDVGNLVPFVNQPGGIIQIDIKEDDTIYMTGSVGYVADMSVAESFFS